MSEQIAHVSRPQAVTPLGVGRRARPVALQDAAWPLLRALSDVAAFVAAGAVSGVAAASTLGFAWHAVLLLAFLGALAASGAYASRPTLSGPAEARQVLVVTGGAMIAVAALMALFSDRAAAAEAIAVHWLLSGLAMTTGRVAVRGMQRATWAREGRRGRTLIVGAGRVGQVTARRLAETGALGLTPIGFLDKEPLGADGHGEHDLPPVLGASWDLERVVAEQDVDHVIVAFSTAPHAVMLDIVRRCWKLGVTVMMVPRLYEVEGRRAGVEHLGGLPLVPVSATDARGWRIDLKYAIDRIVAAVALIVLSPLLIAIVLGILITTGRPILFRQQRVGRDGQGFDMLKFRTMVGSPELDGEADVLWAARAAGGHGADADRPLAPVEDRRTPLGRLLRRLSLDELPQLWNVLRGDMALVGPRPERVDYVKRFDDVVYRYPDRHRVKSGLTGWAQVHGLRGETSLADRVEWDNFYIENWSFWLDLRIIWRTLPALWGRGGD